MDLVSDGPLRAASLLWQQRAGLWMLTVVCKGTFDLRPGTSPLAAEQDLPNEDDNHWDDDPSRSLSSPADMVPFKPRADVTLVGSAFAPRQQPVRSLVARLVAGGVDKAIVVHGKRALGADGQVGEAVPFVRMRLRYERAAGGPDTANPVGVRCDGVSDAQGAMALPNLEPQGASIARRGELIAPIGFGPLAPSWPERRARLGRHAGAWPGPRWTDRPVPEDIDPAYFNAAPRDQQVDSIRDDERIMLENLHPEHARLTTSLPNVRPRVVVERSHAAPAELAMTADTLWIDTDRGACTVTWRGQIRLAGRDEAGRVTVSLGSRDEQGEGATAGDAATTLVPVPRAAPVMPFAAGRAEESPMARPSSTGAPTVLLGSAATAEIEEISVDEIVSGGDEPRGGDAVQTIMLGQVSPQVATMPFLVAPPSPPAVPFAREPPLQPAPRSSPWAVAGVEGKPAPSIGEQAISPVQAPPSARRAPAGAGVLDASNAAAGAAPVPAEARPPAPQPAAEARPRAAPREVIKLLWFDARSLPRIRKQSEWRVLLAELELRLLDEGEDHDDTATPDGEPRPKDKRDVFEVLAKGRPIGPEGVKPALTDAIDDDGRFDPPLVLLAGELELPFDELATLRATAAAVSPFAIADRKLKEQLDVVEELLKTPWLQGSGSIARGLTDKIEEAFAQTKRGVGPEYLSAHTERMLLEQRCYQMRTVFGKRWIRSLLGGSGVPVYVPEALKDELPMFKKVRVRLIGEVDMPEDQFEAGGAAIKVVALGRVMG